MKIAEQQMTGLTLMTLPVYLGIRGIIRLIMKTPEKKWMGDRSDTSEQF